MGLSQRFVVQYCGNIGRTHGIEVIAQCAKQMVGQNVHFTIMGAGGKKQWFEKFVRKNALQNVSILPPCHRENLGEIFSSCDISLISLIPGMAGISDPSRVYNVLAAGRPLIAIADPESEVAQQVLEEAIGWTVLPGDPGLLENTIRAAMACKGLETMGIKARQIAERDYSYEKMASHYQKYVASKINHRFYNV